MARFIQLTETKELTGWYTKESYAPEEVLLSVPVRYSDREGLVATDGQELGDFIKSRKFLFTQLSFKKSDRKGLVYNSTFTNPVSRDTTFHYRLEDSDIKDYLNSPHIPSLDIHTYKEYEEKKFLMTVMLMSDKSDYFVSESIEEK